MLLAIDVKSGGEFDFGIINCDCFIGVWLFGEIVKCYGNQGMVDSLIIICFKGMAGQSFGVWNVGGLYMYLEGDVNDYVGKGMIGGKLVVYLFKGSLFCSEEIFIIGNICFYGVIGGKLFVFGQVGECFGVCNLGVYVVVEGVGDYGCEYMIGGLIIVLGEIGYNFGVGMIGGFVYVLDEDKIFVDKYNYELVEIQCIYSEDMEGY